MCKNSQIFQKFGTLSYFYDQGSDIGVMVTLWHTHWHTKNPDKSDLIPTWQFALFLTVTIRNIAQFSWNKDFLDFLGNEQNFLEHCSLQAIGQHAESSEAAV